jgi:DNA-binding FrmR family transcriptional regulator
MRNFVTPSTQKSLTPRKSKAPRVPGLGCATKSAVHSNKASSCSSTSPKSKHPDHHRHVVALRRVQGQVAGIMSMIAEGRYCIDVMTQLKAASASLRSIEALILETHLRSCVQSAIESKNSAEAETKINELMKLFSRRS